ncbi:large ribosomal subunit protein uL1 [Amyelois transitella]|uniref:large ribosomal subunit protein uL1 n=1 Tax=Amyelois transitella TaxID=680683 RepID=UPI00298F40A6|nr:large ribosomal subunit protein uL1 [Amyelois transitella]
MAGTLFRSILTNSITFYKNNPVNLKSFHTATVYYAARKGTRAKARAKKVKVEVTKVGFIPHNQRGKDKVQKVHQDKHLDDSYKSIPKDDVYPLKFFRWVVYTAEDAVKAHQETHHPTMFNVPDALVFAQVEMNMKAAKNNRYLDSFNRLTLLPHAFPRDEERTILAFCKGPEITKEAINAGATTAGGPELVKKIQEGTIKLSDYDFVIAHPNILTELVPIRGLMKRRFPNLKAGTLDPNLPQLVKKFAAGVQYRVVKDDNQQDFGSAEVPVGRLNMDAAQVAENIGALLKDLQQARPKRDGLFITRCIIVSPPSKERFKIDPFVYVDRTLSKEVQEDSDDEAEPIAARA